MQAVERLHHQHTQVWGRGLTAGEKTRERVEEKDREGEGGDHRAILGVGREETREHTRDTRDGAIPDISKYHLAAISIAHPEYIPRRWERKPRGGTSQGLGQRQKTTSAKRAERQRVCMPRETARGNVREDLEEVIPTLNPNPETGNWKPPSTRNLNHP